MCNILNDNLYSCEGGNFLNNVPMSLVDPFCESGHIFVYLTETCQVIPMGLL